MYNVHVHVYTWLNQWTTYMCAHVQCTYMFVDILCSNIIWWCHITFVWPHTLRAAMPPEDPNAPKPVGPSVQPAVGVPLESRHDWHRNMESAIQHYSSTMGKSPVISMVDPHGKVSVAATYSELVSGGRGRGLLTCTNGVVLCTGMYV